MGIDTLTEVKCISFAGVAEMQRSRDVSSGNWGLHSLALSAGVTTSGSGTGTD